MKSLRNQIFTVVFILSFLSMIVAADHFFWGGPNRDGIYNEQNLLKEWPENGPELLWQINDIGDGYSSVAVALDKVYVPAFVEGEGYIWTYDLEGKLIWKTSYGPEWRRAFPGTRSTPTIYDGRLYIISGMGRLTCMDANIGDVLWTVELLEKFDADNIQYGISETVLIEDDRIICTPGGMENNIVALNRKTGELIWSSQGNSEASAYCSATIIERNGQKIILTLTAGSLIAVDFNSGEVLLHKIIQNNFSIFANTPIYRDNFVFCLAGYRLGSVMFEMSPDSRDAKEIWRTGSLDNQMGGAIVIDDRIYSSGHVNDPSWQCLDWRTGKLLHKSTMLGQGSVIYADGLFYCYSEQGTVGLVKADDKEFKLISSFEITEGSSEHFAHPVVADGKLFVRHGDALMVYDIRK